MNEILTKLAKKWNNISIFATSKVDQPLGRGIWQLHVYGWTAKGGYVYYHFYGDDLEALCRRALRAPLARKKPNSKRQVK